MHTENSINRPRIGLTSGRAGVPVTEGELQAYYVGRNYVRAVIEVGGIPVLFPAVDTEMEAVVAASLDLIDGLVLPGGCDLSPELYGGASSAALDADPVRDEFELAMLAGAIERELPVLGVCRGMELINVHRGGTLRNGVSHPGAHDVHVDALGRVRVHEVNVQEGTLAHRVFGATRTEATCVHHQAPDAIGADLVASVVADDGAIEAVEDADRDLFGVIWHPELGLDRTSSHQLPYSWVVERARAGRAEG